MDPRPRNNQGQFAPEEAGGIDANTTSTAYNPQIIEARKASLIEKIRRMRGARSGVEESVPQREQVLSAKLRLRELARQAYDPYAPKPTEPGQAGRDFRNAAIGIGALGVGGGVAYAGFRGAQAAKSAQTLTDDALKTSGEARKAARSARVAAARVNRAGAWAKTQMTTFPTFKKAGLAVARAMKFDARLKLKELAARSDDWRKAGYIGYATGGMPNAMQGLEIQQYYNNKGVEYRKRDAIKHALPGFVAGAASLPLAIRLAKSINNKPTLRGNLVRKLVIGGGTGAAVLATNAVVGGKKQAVPDREKRIKAKEFSNREYDRLKEEKLKGNLRKSAYIGNNIGSYQASALGGAAAGLATGGLLLGRRGVTKKAALIGVAGMVGARAAMQPKINKWEDRALRANLKDSIAADSGLAAARHIPFIAGTAGTAAILMNRAKILKASEKLAKKFRSARAARPGKWEVIPAPKGDLPMPSRAQLP